MSDFKSAIQNLVRTEFYNQFVSQNTTAARLGTVVSVNDDGSVQVNTAAGVVQATPLYPCVKDQQVMVIPSSDGSVNSCAPFGPNTPAQQNQIPPFFSGAKTTGIRVVGFAANNPPPNTNGGNGLFFQQQGDANIYFLDFTQPPYNASNIQATPFGLSPNGRYLGFGNPNPINGDLTAVAGCIDLGTKKWTGDDSNLLDDTTKTYLLNDQVKLISTGQWVEIPGTVFNDIIPFVRADNDGNVLFMVYWISNDGTLFGYDTAKIIPDEMNQNCESIFSLAYSTAEIAGTYMGVNILGDVQAIEILQMPIAKNEIPGMNLFSPITTWLDGGIMAGDQRGPFFYDNFFSQPLAPLIDLPFQNEPTLFYTGVLGPSTVTQAWGVAWTIDTNPIVLGDPFEPPFLVTIWSQTSALNSPINMATFEPNTFDPNDFVSGNGPVFLFDSKNKYVLSIDDDTHPRLYTLTGTVTTVLSQSDHPVTGFSPNWTPDDAIVRIMDSNDIFCNIWDWSTLTP